MNKYTKELFDQARDNNIDVVSLLGERAHEVINNSGMGGGDGVTLLKNALWFISNQKLSEDFLQYMRDFEEDFFQD